MVSGIVGAIMVVVAVVIFICVEKRKKYTTDRTGMTMLPAMPGQGSR